MSLGEERDICTYELAGNLLKVGNQFGILNNHFGDWGEKLVTYQNILKIIDHPAKAGWSSSEGFFFFL